MGFSKENRVSRQLLTAALNFRNEIHCTVLLSLNLRWPQVLWQNLMGGRSIAVYRILIGWSRRRSGKSGSELPEDHFTWF